MASSRVFSIRMNHFQLAEMVFFHLTRRYSIQPNPIQSTCSTTVLHPYCFCWIKLSPKAKIFKCTFEVKLRLRMIEPNIGKSRFIFVRLLVRHCPVLSHPKQSKDWHACNLYIFIVSSLDEGEIEQIQLIDSTCASQYSHRHLLSKPRLQSWMGLSGSQSGERTMQRFKSRLTLLLLSIISESSGSFLFDLLLLVSSLSFGFLVDREEDGEEEERREEDDDFLLPLTLLPGCSSSSSWFKIERQSFTQTTASTHNCFTCWPSSRMWRHVSQCLWIPR